MLKRLAYLALCACAPLYAAPHIDDQRVQQLANDPFWISLGHYEAGKLSGWRSYVSDDKFFLAPDGAHRERVTSPDGGTTPERRFVTTIGAPGAEGA